MRITKYNVELNQNLQNMIVKESSCNYSADRMDSPIKIVDMMNNIFRLNRQAEEHLYMLAFNVKCRLLGVFEISHGTVDCSLVTPREIFIRALLCGASGIILIHNHPSQDTNPSREDMQVYRGIKEAGEIIGVQLYDNIIVGSDYYSFKEENILE